MGRTASLRALCDAQLLEQYELEDDEYAYSTRATLCAEFLYLCRASEWMRTAFVNQEGFGELCVDVDQTYLEENLRYAMNLRNSLQRQANKITVKSLFSKTQLTFFHLELLDKRLLA